MTLQLRGNDRVPYLPIEISTRILTLSIVPTRQRWITYRSLIFVSREMQALAYHTYLPHLPIMLHTRNHVDSFCMLLESNPNTVGPRIRTLWVVSGIKANVESAFGRTVLQKCTQITHLACNINFLKSLVCHSSPLSHRNLKELTLIETIIPWKLLLTDTAGRQLFKQLTHLRISGGTFFSSPDFSFSSLTHLSYSCHQLSFGSSSTLPFNSDTFPVLRHIAPSFPYLVCRTWTPEVLNARGREIDPRISVIACPKKWKEADVWETAILGGNDLWARAHKGEYLQRSRAFTQEVSLRDDYDDGLEDFCYRSDWVGPLAILLPLRCPVRYNCSLWPDAGALVSGFLRRHLPSRLES